MKAAVYEQFGSPEVLKIKEVEVPIPRDDEVLVKVFAASINFGDLSFLMGKPLMVRAMGSGLLKPKFRILGSDISGRVEAVGKSVTMFQPGDEVFADISESGWGGYAEYVAVPQGVLAIKPRNVTLVQAAALPQAVVVALQGLRDVGKVQPGQSVLVVGASGGVGSYTIQIAKAFGAEVTGVCSTRNIEMVYGLGADHVIDYTQEDFATDHNRYDIIAATAGYRPIRDYVKTLKPEGTYVIIGGALRQIFEGMLLGQLLSIGTKKKIANLMSKPNQQDLSVVSELVESGKVRPVIDRCYPLEQIAEALRYYQTGHAHGKVVITVNQNSSV